MSLPTTRVLVLSADLFEDSELLYPMLRLREEEAEVVLATPGGEPITGKRGHGPVAADASFEQVAADAFDAVVVPGGFAPDAVRRSPAALDLIRAFDLAGKPVAIICHAGWVPISAGIVAGRRVTGFHAIRDDLVNAGVEWVDEPVVVDGTLISARHPGDLGPWMKALIAALAAD